MTEQFLPPSISLRDRARLRWAAMRYDLWLDLRFVPRHERKNLETELVSNLSEASSHIGTAEALRNIGSLRLLAKETAIVDTSRPRWYAGFVAGLTALFSLLLLFLLQTLTWVEGVLDAGATEEVSSSLFPFVWSKVAMDPDPASGFAFTAEPGLLPFALALMVWAIAAKPWLVVGSRSVAKA